MDTKQKTRAGLAGGLAALALIVGGASVASGDASSPASTTAPSTSGATPSGQAQPAASDGAQPSAPSGADGGYGHRGDGDRPCSHEGGGPRTGSSQEQPSAPTAPSVATATPQT